MPTKYGWSNAGVSGVYPEGVPPRDLPRRDAFKLTSSVRMPESLWVYGLRREVAAAIGVEVGSNVGSGAAANDRAIGDRRSGEAEHGAQ